MSCCCYLSLLSWVAIPLGLWFLLKTLYEKWSSSKMEKMLAEWGPGKTAKDVVIVHRNSRGKTIPSASPFVLKLETFLRMADIKYELDFKNRYGPKGKFPWISLNGHHVPDSQLAIEFLSKKFEKDLSKNIDPKKLAVATMCRVALEEHCFWGLALERFVFEGRHQIDKYFRMPYPQFSFIIKRLYTHMVLSRSKAQGIGLHTEQDITQFMIKDLTALSTILGTNKFICGDQFCAEDAAIFGLISQVIWTAPNSVYGKLLKGELQNLEAYCIRIKEKFWPDWEQMTEK